MIFVFSLATTVGVYSLGTGLGSTELAYRFTNEKLDEDSRWIELDAMFEQIKGSVLVGRGAGSGFLSPVIVASEQEDLGLAPHFGFFSWVLKGGVLATIWYSLLLFHIIRSIAAKNISGKAIGVAGLFTLGVSLSSGGYGLTPLTFLGVLWGIANRRG
jgi:hypothetical protein